ncbi:GNAT family protein [Bdellovibrionota bacterium FG-2]
MSNNDGKYLILSTNRLTVRLALLTETDIDFLFLLWNNPEVMKHVGFPNGLKTTREKVWAQLEEQSSDAPFDCRLLVCEKETGTAIGECKLGSPDAQGICETDVKLLPEFWGRKYGIEIKLGLLDYLFTHTNCRAVKATPNILNIASIKMQEAVGGVRVGEFHHEFPDSPEFLKGDTTPVSGYVYLVKREDWESRKGRG